MKINFRTRGPTQISLIIVISALYTILTIGIAPFSYNVIQIRISEVLTPLPFYLGLPGVIGLTIGCFVSNFISPYGLLDVFLGSIGTFIGAIGSYYSNKLWQACLSPVLSNSIIIGILLSFYGIPFFEGFVFVGIGELISCYFLGYPIMRSLEKALPQYFNSSLRMK